MKLVLLASLSSLIVATTFAQQKQESYEIPRYYFLAGGIGIGLLDYEYNLGVGYRDHGTLFGVNVLRSGGITGIEIGPFGGGTTHFKRPVESITEAYAYVGRTAFDKGFQATATVGLGFSTGIVRGNFLYNDGGHDHFEELHIAHIVLPVDGQIAFVPSDRYAIFVSYHASFNAVKTYRGFIFGVQYTLY
jgi:hypothetical protein